MVHDYHILKTPVELPTFLFSGNYRSPSFAFQLQYLSYFSAVLYLVTTVKFYNTIFRFNLLNFPIDHLHKLISPLSIEFIRMELRLHYICTVYRCIVIFLQVDYCLLKPQKCFELRWFNIAMTTTGGLGLSRPCDEKNKGDWPIKLLNLARFLIVLLG